MTQAELDPAEPSAGVRDGADTSAGKPLAARFRAWVKARETPLARLIYTVVSGARSFSAPYVAPVHRPLFWVADLIGGAWSSFVQAFWSTPRFRSKLAAPAPRLQLEGGSPTVMGPVRITLGDSCRVSGRFIVMGRSAGAATPELTVGRNVDLGWGGAISVGRRVVIGDNVRLAPGVMIAGYPGHPIDAAARARGEPDTEDQVGDVIIDDDVWLATNAAVLAGVTIGRGAIIATNSVVTKDIPPFVLAAGAPARVIKELPRPADAAAPDQATPDQAAPEPSTSTRAATATEEGAA